MPTNQSPESVAVSLPDRQLNDKKTHITILEPHKASQTTTTTMKGSRFLHSRIATEEESATGLQGSLPVGKQSRASRVQKAPWWPLGGSEGQHTWEEQCWPSWSSTVLLSIQEKLTFVFLSGGYGSRGNAEQRK